MLEGLEALPPDPILGTIVACRNDPNPDKVDLGVGQYKDAAGTTPIFRAVRAAEDRVLAGQQTKGYVPPPGDPTFLAGVVEQVLGAQHPAVVDERVGAVQTTGGSGALRVLAGLLLRAREDAPLWVPDPTWGNHTPLLGAAGLAVSEYPYYDKATHTLQFDAMMGDVRQRGPGDVVLVHGCCHNPCGADLSPGQWDVFVDVAQERGFTPFVDLAYQGLGEGIDADVRGIRLLAERVPEVIVAWSASKNFGLYRERTGAAITVAATPTLAATQTSQMANIARELYSMPPAHGASIVAEILRDDDLAAMWRAEVDEMRTRLNGLRALLSERLRVATGGTEFDYVEHERGMFSFLGLSPDQVAVLQRDHSVYTIPSSRMNVAGITEDNVDRVARAVAAVV